MAAHDAADLSCMSPAGPTGDDYQGEYKRDKRNGVGVYMFASGASGATYEGDFKDGKPHGIGVYTFRSGKKTLGSRGRAVLCELLCRVRHGLVWCSGCGACTRLRSRSFPEQRFLYTRAQIHTRTGRR